MKHTTFLWAVIIVLAWSLAAVASAYVLLSPNPVEVTPPNGANL